MYNFTFFSTAILLGVGLAMDAFTVSLANGLNEPNAKLNKTIFISATFSLFQALMPMIGWFLVTTVVEHFKAFEVYIPYIALALLTFIGGKMIYESKHHTENSSQKQLGVGAILVQGIATSIDALSTGFTISTYNLPMALITALIIAVITFIMCFVGVNLGKKFGTVFAGKASVLGGLVLIFIGLEIFITSFF
jgi:putative Mn2+ efflux pump MntP